MTVLRIVAIWAVFMYATLAMFVGIYTWEKLDEVNVRDIFSQVLSLIMLGILIYSMMKGNVDALKKLFKHIED
jgi:hypothetical protein